MPVPITKIGQMPPLGKGAMSVVTVNPKLLTLPFLRQVFMDEIHPLITKPPLFKYQDVLEVAFYRPILAALKRFLQAPDEPDGTLGNVIRQHSMYYKAIADLTATAGIRGLDENFLKLGATQLNQLYPSIDLIKTELTYTEDGVKKELEISKFWSMFVSRNLQVQLDQIDLSSYEGVTLADVPPDTLLGLYGELFSFATVHQPPINSQPARMAMYRMMGFMISVIERDLFPNISLQNSTGMAAKRPYDLLLLMNMLKIYTDFASDEDKYQSLIVYRIDQGFSTEKVRTVSRMAKSLSWMFAQSLLAPMRMSYFSNKFFIDELFKVASTIQWADHSRWSNIVELKKASDDTSRVVGTPLKSDSLMVDYVKAIAGLAPYPDTVVLTTSADKPQSGFDSYFKLNASFFKGDRPYDVLPDWNGVAMLDVHNEIEPIINQEKVILNDLLYAYQGLRIKHSDMFNYYQLLANPSTLEEFNDISGLSGVSLSIKPEFSWTATVDGVGSRSLTHINKALAPIPLVKDKSPIFANILYKNIFKEAFFSRLAAEEYDTMRYYWPALPAYTVLNPSFSLTMRSYVPFSYIDDIVLPMSSNTREGYMIMLRALANDAKQHPDYFEWIASELGDYDPSRDTHAGWVIESVSSMAAIYDISQSDLAEADLMLDDFDVSTLNASLLMPSIGVTYGIPYRLFVTAQPKKPKSYKKYHVRVLGSDGIMRRYLFVIHSRFPEPTEMVYFSYFIQNHTPFLVPISYDLVRHFTSKGAPSNSMIDINHSSFDKIRGLDVMVNDPVVYPSDDKSAKRRTSFLHYLSAHNLVNYTLSVVKDNEVIKQMATDDFRHRLNELPNGDALLKNLTNISPFEIRFLTSELSRVSASWPHLTFRGHKPSNSSIGWNLIKTTAWYNQIIVPSEMGNIVKFYATPDEIVSYTMDDKQKAIEQMLTTTSIYEKINNLPQFRTESDNALSPDSPRTTRRSFIEPSEEGQSSVPGPDVPTNGLTGRSPAIDAGGATTIKTVRQNDDGDSVVREMSVVPLPPDAVNNPISSEMRSSAGQPASSSPDIKEPISPDNPSSTLEFNGDPIHDDESEEVKKKRKGKPGSKDGDSPELGGDEGVTVD
jgi:hypothetical protein